MKTACIQMDVVIGNRAANLAKALRMTEHAIGQGAELIVLPEVFSTGFCYDNIAEMAERYPYPSLGPFIELSATHDCIITGSIIGCKEREGKHFENVGFCLSGGEIRGTYSKTHPFKKENAYFSRGESICVIAVPEKNLTIGLEICYELRFPEVARKLVLQGADILITVAQFPDPGGGQWKMLSRSRAIENQLPHIVCNRTGHDGDTSFFGNSMIIDARGDVVAAAGREETVLVGETDLALSSEMRSLIPVFGDRREELY